jgi:hypothetical protein
MQYREVAGQLSGSSENERAAVIGKRTAESQRDEIAKQPRVTSKSKNARPVQTVASQPRRTNPIGLGNAPQSHLARLVEANRNLPKGTEIDWRMPYSIFRRYWTKRTHYGERLTNKEVNLIMLGKLDHSPRYLRFTEIIYAK